MAGSHLVIISGTSCAYVCARHACGEILALRGFRECRERLIYMRINEYDIHICDQNIV